MPIRFECDQCGQRLSIARRKAGTKIDCPTCGLKQCVPGEPVAEEPSDPAETDVTDDGSTPDELEDQVPFYLDSTDPEPPAIPDDVDLTETIDLDYPPVFPSGSAAPPAPPPLPSSEREEPVAPRLPIPWAIYSQALLLLVVAVGGFSAGYYLGHQDGSAGNTAPLDTDLAAMEELGDGFAEEKVLLEVRLLWAPTVGETKGDSGAVFIALPRDRIPSRSLPIAGLQPGNENHRDAGTSAVAIQAVGGVFERAGGDGTVAAILPREGRYDLLMISHSAQRPVDQPIDAGTLVGLKQYFADPEELIGVSKYAWQPVEIRVGAAPVEHDFGLDGL